MLKSQDTYSEPIVFDRVSVLSHIAVQNRNLEIIVIKMADSKVSPLPVSTKWSVF